MYISETEMLLLDLESRLHGLEGNQLWLLIGILLNTIMLVILIGKIDKE